MKGEGEGGRGCSMGGGIVRGFEGESGEGGGEGREGHGYEKDRKSVV